MAIVLFRLLLDRVVKHHVSAKRMAGHFAKASTEAGNGLWEFRTESADTAEIETRVARSRLIFSKLARK